VDDPTVKFAAWLYRRIQRDGEKEQKPVALAPLTRVE
jgi:hypothetical protein